MRRSLWLLGAAIVLALPAWLALRDQSATALDLEPEDAPARLRLGRLYLEATEPERAAAEFRRALAADSSCVAASYGLGQVAAERGDREAAVQHYRSALASRPELSQVRYALGMALRDLGRLEEASSQLAEAAAQGGGLGATAWQGCTDPVLASVGDLATMESHSISMRRAKT